MCASNRKSDEHVEVTFALGRVHDKIGGPTRTIWGYVQGLEAQGTRTRIAGIGTTADLESSFADAGATKLSAIGGGVFPTLVELFKLYRNSASAIVIVGVWHLPFFWLGGLKIASKIAPWLGSPRMILVPTMSLTSYDWAKHRLLKLCSSPFVRFILQSIDGVVFASTGELEASRPRSWSRSQVILHPSVSISSYAPSHPDVARDIDVLFVGRLDAQKDLPLLLRSFSQLHGEHVLHIVGDGAPDYVNELKWHAEQLGIQNRVIWHGWKSHTETLGLFARARVVAVTSVVENYCHAAVEALVAETDLVLVERVMSAKDFARLADIDVTPAHSAAVASAMQSRLESWVNRRKSRKGSAEEIRHACDPRVAARALSTFISRDS